MTPEERVLNMILDEIKNNSAKFERFESDMRAEISRLRADQARRDVQISELKTRLTMIATIAAFIMATLTQWAGRLFF